MPPSHNGIIAITIKGHNLKALMGYFISNHHVNKGLDPNIHVIDGIYNIKGRSAFHVLVANYTNMSHSTITVHRSYRTIHWPFAAHTSISSLTTQKMKDEHIQPDTFTPPLHTVLGDARESLNQLLETFKLQFAQDETSIGNNSSCT